MKVKVSHIKKILIQRLGEKGVSLSTVPCFIKDLDNFFSDNPNMSHLQADEHLHYLGWNDFELDYHTLQFALACIEADKLKGLEHELA